MNSADIVIGIFLILFISMGFYEGLLKKLFGLIVLVLSFFIAVKFYIPFSEWMQSVLGFSPLLATILSFLILFLGFLIGGNVLYRLVGKRNDLYKTWDRLAGALFGMLEGAIIVSLILHLLLLADVPSEVTRDSSFLYQIVYPFAPFLFNLINLFIPEIREFFDLFRNGVEIHSQLIY